VGVLRWIGLKNAAAWAIVVELVHITSYFGPLLAIVVTIVTGLVVFIEFESLATALVMVDVALAIATPVCTVGHNREDWQYIQVESGCARLSGAWGLLLGVLVIAILTVLG
jgi:hypothetical protein